MKEKKGSGRSLVREGTLESRPRRVDSSQSPGYIQNLIRMVVSCQVSSLFLIFVIDPEQEEGFNRFKDALFKANPEDSNARAYLGN